MIKRLPKILTILCLAILALLMAMAFGDELFAASLTQNKVVAWDQRRSDLEIKAGTTTRPLDHWIMQFRDSPTGPIVNTLDFPYDASRLTGPNAAGDMTYTSVPIAITMTGVGGTTLQKCITVTAYGTHTPPPPKETAPSNQVCISFALPPDPVSAPGAPSQLQVQ